MPDKVWVGKMNDDVEILLKARRIPESDENYPKDPMHMYTEIAAAMKRIGAVLSVLPSGLYTVEANDDCKCPLGLIQAAQNQRQTIIGGLAKLLK